MAKKINSKQKGKKGELDVAHLFQEHGFAQARRSQQYAGINNDADVVGAPFLHLEVKNVEKLNLYKAIEQSVNDAKEDQIPVVFHTRNRKPWYVTLNAEDFMNMYKAWLKGWEE